MQFEVGFVSLLRNVLLMQEMVRSVHVYKWDEHEEVVEREFMFYQGWTYEELKLPCKIFTVGNFDISPLFVGMVCEAWECIFVFDSYEKYNLPASEFIPELLLSSRNHKLAAIPTLANDLDIIFQYIFHCTDALQVLPEARREVQNNVICLPQRTQRVPMFDLNVLPDPVSEKANDGKRAADKKQKRAATGDISRLAVEDLAKYFDFPIVEASKNLKVGLTVLRKKCREFGIPRWPHRKIKSLDGLIHNLQEEGKRQQEADKAAAMAVVKRQRMIESEKESIEGKPFLDIKMETKKFRQDIFKRRHRARVLGNQS